MKNKEKSDKFVETNTEDSTKNGNYESYIEASNKTDYDLVW